MELFEQLKNIADKNGDGKIGFEDLETLKNGENNSLIDQLEQQADQNADGKLDISDLEGLNFQDLLGNITNLFGKK